MKAVEKKPGSGYSKIIPAHHTILLRRARSAKGEAAMDPFLMLCASNPLFRNIAPDDIPALLDCLHAVRKQFKKGELLFGTGQQVTQLGIVLAGIVHVESSDVLGNRNIISYMNPGQLFCDAYSCTENQLLLVDIAAQTDCTVLLIETRQLFRSCAGVHPYHDQMRENLIHVLAQKFVDLGCKVVHLAGRSTRAKLLSYLSEQYRLAGEKPFAIPLTQQELADYLFVERSGMSTELNKLLREGILVSLGGTYTLTAQAEEV